MRAAAERFTLDTDVLVYAADASEGERHLRAVRIVDQAVDGDCVLTLQSLAEFFATTTRRHILTAAEAHAVIRDWLDLFLIVPASTEALIEALRAAERGTLHLWDALLLFTAREAGCAVVLSENTHNHGRIAGLKIRNPFLGPTLPANVARLLGP